MRARDETVGRRGVCQQALHGHAFNALSVGTRFTSIRRGFAVSAFGSVIVRTPRSHVALIALTSIEADSLNVRSKGP